jgi:hypothetical protein
MWQQDNELAYYSEFNENMSIWEVGLKKNT